MAKIRFKGTSFNFGANVRKAHGKRTKGSKVKSKSKTYGYYRGKGAPFGS